jgi:hypothetical protein
VQRSEPDVSAIVAPNRSCIGEIFLMLEIVRALFDTASTADMAANDLTTARIPSAVVRLTSGRLQRHGGDSASGWNRIANTWQRPLVTVSVDNTHALAVMGILRQYGPMHIEQLAA